jgi:hypothetical protein
MGMWLCLPIPFKKYSFAFIGGREAEARVEATKEK